MFPGIVGMSVFDVLLTEFQSVSRPTLDCQGLVLCKDSLGLFLSRHPREALGREGGDRGYSHRPAVGTTLGGHVGCPVTRKCRGSQRLVLDQGFPTSTLSTFEPENSLL